MTWTIVEDGYQPEDAANWEVIFSLGNGYVMMRSGPEEGSEHPESSRYQTIAGLYGWHKSQNICAAALPTWQAYSLTLAGEGLLLSEKSVKSYTRTFDMRDGSLIRTFKWTSPSGKETELTFHMLLSWDRRHIMAQKLTAKPLNWNGELLLTQNMDGACKTNGECIVEPISTAATDNSGIEMTIKAIRTDLRVSIKTALKPSGSCAESELERKSDLVVSRATSFAVEQGKEFTCERLIAVCTDFENTTRDNPTPAGPAPDVRASEELATVMALSWDQLRAENKSAWARKWQDCDVRIGGDNSAQRDIRWHIFQLMQSLRGDDDRINLDAKLMTGDEYGGHYFWDTELYSLPFFLYTMPEAGHNLVKYRAYSLHGALAKAKRLGFKGAFYPWEADPSGKEENVPDKDYDENGKEYLTPYGRIQLHVNSAVVYGLNQYCIISGNMGFWHGPAAPVILQCARFWADWGEWEGDAFVIKGVMCPDEYHYPVDNNLYTNMTARWNMEKAVELLETVTSEQRCELETSSKITPAEIEEWKRIIKGMRVPMCERLGILDQAEGFCDLPEFDFGKYSNATYLYRQCTSKELAAHQVIKQADLIAYFRAFPSTFDREMMQKCWDYYVPRTAHDSSLSEGSHAVVGAILGRDEEAWHHYRMVLDTDLKFTGNRYHTQGGVHAANAGNAWAGAVQGFAGVNVDDDSLICNPRLPEHWNSLEFGIFYKGRRCEFSIRKDRVSVDISTGEPIELVINGTSKTVTDEETVNVSTN